MLDKKRKYEWDDFLGEDISGKGFSSKRWSGKKVIPVSFSMDRELFLKLSNFCYWKRLKRSEVISFLVSKFLEKVDPKLLEDAPKDSLNFDLD